MLRLKFKDTQSRDSFADRFKLDSKIESTELDVNWNLLQAAKLDDNCVDYDELALLQGTAGAGAEHEYIVKGNPETFAAHGTVKKDLGNGFYLVASTDGTTLGDHVDSIEHTSSPVVYLATDCYIDEMNTEPCTVDPTSADAQWARLRVVSKYRPLSTVFNLHDINYQSKPELIIMDSGINFDHPEFNYLGLETEDFYSIPSLNGAMRDDVGHGTAVASCAAGKNLGIAFNIKLVNVKIGGQGHNATVYEIGEAIDAILNRINDNPTLTRVVNMSWGVARSAWLDSKVQSLIDAGMTVICAAGNQGIDVADISPAGITDVMTVASLDKYDIPSGFNNISPSDAGVTTGAGLSLDIFAPGENVILASTNGSYHVGSGTSFAAPYVAGTAAGIASLYSNIITPSQLKEKVLNAATVDAILFENDKFSENQNRLVHYPLSDPNANQKNNQLYSYLGFLSDQVQNIKFNVSSILPYDDVRNYIEETPETFNFNTQIKINFTDPAIGEKYSPYVTFDVDKPGQIDITYPRFDMPEETKLVLVEFDISIMLKNMTITTPKIFFYDTNYKYETTIQGDVTLALTETNSISFYGFWSTLK